MNTLNEKKIESIAEAIGILVMSGFDVNYDDHDSRLGSIYIATHPTIAGKEWALFIDNESLVGENYNFSTASKLVGGAKDLVEKAQSKETADLPKIETIEDILNEL